MKSLVGSTDTAQQAAVALCRGHDIPKGAADYGERWSLFNLSG